MKSNFSAQPVWPVYGTLLLLMLLNVFQFGGWVQDYVPNLVLMVVMFWAIYRPDSMTLTTAWFTGLIQDVLSHGVIGQYAMVYVILVFVLNAALEKTRQYAFLEYVAWLLVFLLLDIIVAIVLQHLLSQGQVRLHMFMPLVGAVVIWPFLYFFLSQVDHFASRL